MADPTPEVARSRQGDTFSRDLAAEPHDPSAESQRAEAAVVVAKAEEVKNGELIQKAVAELHGKLTELASEHKFEIGELRNFGMEFDVFDPVTGMLMSPARAHRRDIGDVGQLMGAEAVVSDIVAARQHQKTAGVTQYSVIPVQNL